MQNQFECKSNETISTIYIGVPSDFKVVDGKLTLKRKYGKYKRKLVKLDLNDSRKP